MSSTAFTEAQAVSHLSPAWRVTSELGEGHFFASRTLLRD